jgi:phage-related protein (TIGR01555 family)
MYRGNIWVKKAVSIPASYAVKGWRKIEDEAFMKIERKIKLKTQTSEALKWAALFGGSMAVLIVDDGLSPDQPINYKALKEDSFKRVVIVDRWKVTFTGIEQDPLSDNFMEPESYLVTINGRSARYHPSRCHKFITDTLPWDEMVTEQYWGISQIEIIYRQLIADDVFLSSVANMMKKATVDIMGIPNLSMMIKNGQEEQVKERVRIAQSAMSTLNTWVKDAGANGQNAETYERITQAFAGFDTMDIQSLNRIAAASEIPATIFLGKSPDGMNATGDSDISIFTDRLSTMREITIDPFLEKVDKIISACISIEQPTYDWVNPFPKSEKDEADIRTINMDTILKMSSLEIPDSVLVHRMADWGILEGEDVDDTIKAMEEMEPFEIEEELV